MAQETKKDRKPMLGEILVEHGIITPNMLKNALRRQSQVGGQIGTILIEMGYISTDLLLEFLSNQFGVPSVNLFKIDLTPEILKALPLDKIKEYKVLPIEIGNKYTIAMVNPNDHIAIQNIEFILGKSIQPVIMSSSQMDIALKSLEKGIAGGLKGCTLEQCQPAATGESAVDIKALLRRLAETKASDIQLTAGVPPSLKMSTELRRMNMPPLTPVDMSGYARALMNPEQQESFEKANDLDFAFTDVDLGRFRVNIYKQRSSVSITLRGIPDHIPAMSELGLPDDLEKFALKNQGLILITGPAGHGKSTTLAAMVDVINTKRKCNIVTLEDPIEYLHKHKNCNVNQREIGIDTASFHEGLRHIFRQDPDVIVIGEMRDPISFKIALQAAESGHLVMSTLHARNATSTIERVIDMFPAEQQLQIRSQLAESLVLVLSQRLVMNKDRSAPVLAYEKMINSFKIKTFIRDGKTHQIRSQMQLPGDEYSSIDVSLARLCIDNKISLEEGLKHTDNPQFYQDMVKNRGIR
ncbi:MAG: hypothetical protein C0402_01595 [Thermodesulfovibrio sp.]|nr:hypothetical protein [Thermodesulfovibrio sp.]